MRSTVWALPWSVLEPVWGTAGSCVCSSVSCVESDRPWLCMHLLRSTSASLPGAFRGLLLCGTVTTGSQLVSHTNTYTYSYAHTHTHPHTFTLASSCIHVHTHMFILSRTHTQPSHSPVAERQELHAEHPTLPVDISQRWRERGVKGGTKPSSEPSQCGLPWTAAMRGCLTAVERLLQAVHPGCVSGCTG